MAEESKCSRCGLSTGHVVDLGTGSHCHREPEGCVSALLAEVVRLQSLLCEERTFSKLLTERLFSKATEVERLRASLEFVPKMKDGVPIVHEGPCFSPDGREAHIEPFAGTPSAVIKHQEGYSERFLAEDCFSTRESWEKWTGDNE